MRTVNLATVMRTMGHCDIKTTMLYQHPELEIVRAPLDFLAPASVKHRWVYCRRTQVRTHFVSSSTCFQHLSSRPRCLYVIENKGELLIDTEEVDGSSPFGPTMLRCAPFSKSISHLGKVDLCFDLAGAALDFDARASDNSYASRSQSVIGASTSSRCLM